MDDEIKRELLTYVLIAWEHTRNLALVTMCWHMCRVMGDCEYLIRCMVSVVLGVMYPLIQNCIQYGSSHMTKEDSGITGRRLWKLQKKW